MKFETIGTFSSFSDCYEFDSLIKMVASLIKCSSKSVKFPIDTFTQENQPVHTKKNEFENQDLTITLARFGVSGPSLVWWRYLTHCFLTKILNQRCLFSKWEICGRKWSCSSEQVRIRRLKFNKTKSSFWNILTNKLLMHKSFWTNFHGTFLW